ncbi:MAG: extracellular solute-binding protein, partial [Thaumarchaeota archaeon]|nr:extracellular solute-binding protein [Nitrososphaerota archaeon]
GPSGSGTVLVYGSVDAEDMQTTIDAFHEAYPDIKIDYVRGSPSEVYTRISTEIDAGAKTADVVMLSFPGSLSLVDNGFAQSYKAPNAANWPDELKDPDGFWQGVLILGQVITYNTNLVSEDELPKTLNDLTDPKWNGKITMHDYTRGTTSTRIWATIAEEGNVDVEDFLERLEANVQPVRQRSTGAQNDEVSRGEYHIGIVAQLHDVVKSQMDGAPVAILQLEDFPLMWGPTAAVLLEASENPDAAKVWINFLVSEDAQILIGNVDVRFAALPSVEDKTKHTLGAATPEGMDLLRYPSDAARANHDDWHAIFKEIAGV